MKTEIRIEGGEKLKKKLMGITAQVGSRVLLEAVTRGAEIVRTEAASKAPTRTGKLSREIILEPKIHARTLAVVAVGPSQDAFYGRFVEYGTKATGKHRATQPHPFLFPALEMHREDVKQVVADQIRTELEHVAAE
jgi:HK97 gp10 family phage protein